MSTIDDVGDGEVCQRCHCVFEVTQEKTTTCQTCEPDSQAKLFQVPEKEWWCSKCFRTITSGEVTPWETHDNCGGRVT